MDRPRSYPRGGEGARRGHQSRLADDRNRADQLVPTLHDHAIRRIRDAIAEVNGDEKSRRRLAVQVGTPRAIEDLNTIVTILSLRELLADLARRLPSQFRVFEREQIEPLWTLLDAATTQGTLDRLGARKADAFVYCLILVMNRLAAPWQLVRIATRAAESDDTSRVAESPYAAAVNIVLGEAENMTAELRAEIKVGHPVASMLKNIHDTAREIRSEINVSFDSPWSRQLTAVRDDVSALLKTEIETTPGSVRRLLRPRLNKDIAPGSVLDPLDVQEVETRVEFVSICRHHAAELATSEVTTRAFSELTQILETGTKMLLEFTAPGGDGDRRSGSRSRGRDPLLPPDFRRRIFGPSGQGRRGRGAGRAPSRRAQNGAGVSRSYWRKRPIAALGFPLQPYSRRDV
ncbi:MAG: hypothetical protein WB495_28605 [Xanthobacteraceae bacterium]